MLTVEGLCAGYGALNILQSVSLTVAPGEAVAVVGPNGAGKSTLVKALTGLIPTRGGRIMKDGRELQGLPPHDRPGLGMAVVLEGRHLFGELTIQENLRLAESHGKRTRGDNARYTLEEVTALFPILHDRRQQRVQLLSGGQQQMVAFARALLLQPDLLIMDEPSTGLAPKVFKDIQVVFQLLRDRKAGMLLIEQNVRIAAGATDRAYVMSMGRIVDEIREDEWHGDACADRVAHAYLSGAREHSTPH